MPRPGGTVARGYGAAHRKERQRWVPIVERGEATCWRCGKPIIPGTAWDLGHDDHDRRIYRGPEHASQCNRRAGSKKAAAQRSARAGGANRGTTTLRW
jgi:hypothetical protein